MDGIRIANERREIARSVAVRMIDGIFATEAMMTNTNAPADDQLDEALNIFNSMLPMMKGVKYDTPEYKKAMEKVLSVMDDFFDGKNVSKDFPDVTYEGETANFMKVVDQTMSQVVELQNAQKGQTSFVGRF